MTQEDEQEVRVPLKAWVVEIARESARVVIAEHRQDCPAIRGLPPVVERVQRLEIRLSSLIAFMAGSGLLGGVAGAVVAKAFGG